MTTKRSIESRIEDLEERTSEAGERLEWLTGTGRWAATEPQLTRYLASKGFVIEQEEEVYETGARTLFLHSTPSALDIRQSTLWHYSGPTAPFDDVRIVWDADALAQVRDDADHPTAYAEPKLPEEMAVIEEGDGWQAVAPADRVIENQIIHRSTADRKDVEILQRAPSWVGKDEDESSSASWDGVEDIGDLVEVDADPVPYPERMEDVFDF